MNPLFIDLLNFFKKNKDRYFTQVHILMSLDIPRLFLSPSCTQALAPPARFICQCPTRRPSWITTLCLNPATGGPKVLPRNNAPPPPNAPRPGWPNRMYVKSCTCWLYWWYSLCHFQYQQTLCRDRLGSRLLNVIANLYFLCVYLMWTYNDEYDQD